MSFSVLFVCTGNICRSPIAERLFASRIDSGKEVTASSVGTAGLTGRPMDASAAQALRELGGNSEGHVARRLTPDLISEADLILTSEVYHRSQVVHADPMAFRRVFTLQEFGWLGSELTALTSLATEDQLRSRILEVAEQRGRAATADPGGIGDPYGAPLRVMRACGRQIADAVDAAVALLGLARTPRPADRRVNIGE